MDTLLEEAFKILPVGQVIVLIMMAMIIRAIYHVRDGISKVNLQMSEMKVWQQGYERLMNERHLENLRRFEQIERQIGR